MKAAIYARVSTRDKGQNPEVQLVPLRKYCEAMEWEYIEYIDKASASDLDGRIAWTQLLKDASQHKFDILFIWKLDRAFRSVNHATTTISQLNGYKIGFRSLMDAAIDTTTPNGMLVFNILASVAQFEKDLLVLRINEGITYAKEKGTKSGEPIGRKRYDIAFANLCKAMIEAKGSLSEAARILTRRYNKKVSPGFVLSRIKREGLTKEEVLLTTT
ncbi:MAG: recombinase family protein [Dehalococcoidales bacterium]|nr:recombinase family protein [Dehalococcoidales bacterium]